jgi:hypothetical protein
MLMGNTIEGLTGFTFVSGGTPAEGQYTGGNPVGGFCSSGPTALLKRDCVSGPGTTAGFTGASTVCTNPDVIDNGCTGQSDRGQTATDQFILTALTASSDATKTGDTVVECKQSDTFSDKCTSDGFATKSTCETAGKDIGCVWEGCSFVGDDTFQLGSDSNVPSEATIGYDTSPFTTEYDRWRKCIFNNNLPSNDKALSQGLDATLGADGAMSSTSAAYTGGVTGPTTLLGWAKGLPGYVRTGASNISDITDDTYNDINALPLTTDGKVPDAVKNYLPAKWVTGIENMCEYCRDGDAEGTCILGFSPDHRSLLCLNHNESMENAHVHRKKTKFPCDDKCMKCETGADYSYTPPTLNDCINCTEGYADRAKCLANVGTVVAAQRAGDGVKDATLLVAKKTNAA